MEPLLFLAHRLPFPPDKGDRVRSFHLLQFLASGYHVHLGTFIDNPADLHHVERLRGLCGSIEVARIRRPRARLRSLRGFLTGQPLTLAYYNDASLAEWVRATVRAKKIEKVVVFSSAMEQYVAQIQGLRVVVDFVDVDSAKWRQYGQTRRWPMSAIFEREAEHLLAYERSVARRSYASVFVTPSEAELFRRLAPECASNVHCIQNGVDTEFFSPQHGLPTPYDSDEEPIVFTGAMDYWPNIDAVTWFAQAVLPSIVEKRPRARFHIVGMHPASVVQALSRDPHIVVTGRVPDVRPYLQHAKVVVAPLRVARGIQNKVLEAMAMARPVVVSSGAAAGLSATNVAQLEIADEAGDFARKTARLMDPHLGDKIGTAAREHVVSHYDWMINLSPFETFLRESRAAVDEGEQGTDDDARMPSAVVEL